MDPYIPPRAFFERIFNNEHQAATTPIIVLSDRVMMEFKKSDSKLASFISKKSKKFHNLLTKRREFTAVPVNPSKGSALPVNKCSIDAKHFR